MTDTLLTLSTLEKYLKVLKNNVYDASPTWQFFNAKGRIKEMSSYQLSWDVVAKKHSAIGMWSGFSTVPNQPINPLVKATLPVSQYVAAVSVPKDEEKKNQGPERILNMVQVQFDNAQDTFADLMSTDLFGAGTAVNGMYPLQGLRIAITKDTGTYANIDRSSSANSFWNANTDATAHTVANLKDSTHASYFPLILMKMHTSCSHGGKKNRPDLIVMTKDNFNLYQHILSTTSLRLSTAEGNAEFDSMKLGNVDVIYDDYEVANYVHFLNSNDFTLWIYPDSNFDFDKDDKGSIWKQGTDQLAKVAHIVWMGQLRLDCPRQQGVLSSVGAS